ncbi:hypothetical protein O181_083490 [Austropuccinia psidii MF-1]|uniref:Uncharacterized protein n=1 Tax=Austropuccinia psidii MF-1 TaxID=1389203 RepID=A0A9Q3ILP4_9BASI|nr:hypothetical protein [Austropuccinia psidii MF-1]
MLRLRACKNDLAIAQHGAFDIVISIAKQLCNSNFQPLRISIMTPKQTCTMGQPKLTLYSLVIQPPNPLFKHYHPAINPVCSLRSPVTKHAMCFSAWRICGLHPPCTFNNALTKALPGDWVAI